jgi:hypothetical protein
MGAIAASGHPRALELFHDVMVASASIPVAFPPVYLTVEAEGRTYEEMHVDGGTVMQVFLWGAGFTRAMAEKQLGAESMGRPIRLYVIRNGVVGPEWKGIGSRLKPIGMRAMDTLLKVSGVNDLLRLHAVAVRDGMDFNLAYIPDDFKAPKSGMFDTNYMVKLFDLAYGKARHGYPWLKTPPIAAAKEAR